MELKKKVGKKINISLDDLLEILGNPTRRAMLAKLAKVPHSTSELAGALKISRQAVHSQLDILSTNNLIEKIETDKRGGKYRIKSNISVHIDISPDYYNINYNFFFNIKGRDLLVDLYEMGVTKEFHKKKPSEKTKEIAKRIKDIEINLDEIELERRELIKNKQCLISELKNIIESNLDANLVKEDPEYDNLEKEIALSLFFKPKRYFKQINIDKLLEDVFIADMSMIRKQQSNMLVKHLLRDLSKFMDFIIEEDESWFFDI